MKLAVSNRAVRYPGARVGQQPVEDRPAGSPPAVLRTDVHALDLGGRRIDELFDLTRRYFGDAADLVETWDATADVPVDGALRGRLERTLRLIESAGPGPG